MGSEGGKFGRLNAHMFLWLARRKFTVYKVMLFCHNCLNPEHRHEQSEGCCCCRCFCCFNCFSCLSFNRSSSLQSVWETSRCIRVSENRKQTKKEKKTDIHSEDTM